MQVKEDVIAKAEEPVQVQAIFGKQADEPDENARCSFRYVSR